MPWRALLPELRDDSLLKKFRRLLLPLVVCLLIVTVSFASMPLLFYFGFHEKAASNGAAGGCAFGFLYLVYEGHRILTSRDLRERIKARYLDGSGKS